MKTLLFITLLPHLVYATSYRAFYYDKRNLIKVAVPDKGSYEDAFKKASKVCFKALYRGWMSDEEGLDIIDICANPVKQELE